MFGGTLGDWDTDPVNLKLKPASKLFNSKYHLVPIINKETFLKEIKILVKIGVLNPVQQSQYGTPVFIIPKKEGTARFITEYHRLNQKLARKNYPLPLIGETMQQLEVFQYASALDIRLVPAQGVHFVYTRSHLSALKSCALNFSANFQFIFTFNFCTTQFSH